MNLQKVENGAVIFHCVLGLLAIMVLLAMTFDLINFHTSANLIAYSLVALLTGRAFVGIVYGYVVNRRRPVKIKKSKPL